MYIKESSVVKKNKKILFFIKVENEAKSINKVNREISTNVFEMRKCLILLIIRGMQNKAKLRQPFSPSDCQKFKSLTTFC